MYLPSEPWGIRWGAFSAPSRYSCRHSHSWPLHGRFPACFAATTTLPYHGPKTVRSVGTWLEPRYIVGAAALDQ